MAESKTLNPTDAEKKIPRKDGKNCENMPYAVREAFKRLRTNVLISLSEISEKNRNIIGIASAQPSEGKSTVSINLAYSMAELGKSVIVLDCDLRRPSVHAKLGIAQTPGFTDVLAGKINLNNVLHQYKSSTGGVHFDLITAGEIPDNPSEILNSRDFKHMLEVISNAYDLVILDLPPVNAVIDAAVVSRLTDGLVLVIRENHCPKFVLEDCMEQLKYAKANILGFVMNGSVNGAGKRYQYGKAYRYNSYYSQRYGK